ncbi:Rv3235 family protein [Saccharothrix sp. Mg75]|uniref:Rv3235 family protein n=1 Tax=Saccharothrix sp. Mg75 TaxID=3445357 RepID=UPI003EEDE99D
MPPRLRALPSSPQPGTPSPLDARHFLIPLVEALSGRRPPQQLAPLFPTKALKEFPTTPTTTRLGRYRLCHIAPGKAELAGTLHLPTRTRAFAARVEHSGTRWQCTEFHLLP